MHQRDWEKLTVEEKLEQLRRESISHELWVRVFISTFSRMGIEFTADGEESNAA